jgi:hypothetical protein
MAILDSNIFQNPAIARYLDYAPDVNITGVPFAGDVNIPFEGRTKPVTDISEIAPTGSTKNVLAQGIANAALRNQFDFTKPFSTVVQGSGQPYIRDPNKTYDYSGYKLGNPEEGWKGMGREIWEAGKTLYGGHAPNIIANTLGDYTATYTPGVPQLGIEDVMNLYDRYDFVGKMGEGEGSAYEIDVDLPPELLDQIKGHYTKSPKLRFKQQQLMNKKKQDMQQRIREGEKKRIEQEKIKTAQDNWKPTYNPASSHAEAQATGGDYHSDTRSTVDGQTTDWGPNSAMIARGGLAQYAPRGSYFNGGLASLWLR